MTAHHTTHHSRKTKGRIFVIIAIVIVGYVIFDSMMENYNKPDHGEVPHKESVAQLIAAKEAIKVMPQWKLNNLSGEPFRSESLEGDVALITFWSSDCAVCRSEIPLLRKLDEQYKDQGFRIVAIALDEHEDDDLRAFAIGERLDYTVLRGDTKVAKAFGGIHVVPQTFLVDRQGNIVKFFLGKINEAEIEKLISSAL